MAMLSFLRDQSNDDLPAKQSQAGDETTPDNGAKEPQDQEQKYLTVAAHEKRARKSTILLAILFVAGLLCLGYMIKKSTPKLASGATDSTEDTQLEAAVSKLTGIKAEMSNSMDTVVNKFYELSDVLQVKVGELVKNPFELELVTAKAEEPRVEITVPEIDTEMLKQRQIRQDAKEMELLSIMQSDRGKCCMIGNKILYEGEYIKDFKVRQIGDSFVKLEWDPERKKGSSDNQSDVVGIMLNLTD
jgi:preprotein translocase subunit SecG